MPWGRGGAGGAAPRARMASWWSVLAYTSRLNDAVFHVSTLSAARKRRSWTTASPCSTAAWRASASSAMTSASPAMPSLCRCVAQLQNIALNCPLVVVTTSVCSGAKPRKTASNSAPNTSCAIGSGVSTRSGVYGANRPSRAHPASTVAMVFRCFIAVGGTLEEFPFSNFSWAPTRCASLPWTQSTRDRAALPSPRSSGVHRAGQTCARCWG